MKKQYLELGQIVNVQGLKGEVRVDPWSDTPAFLLKFKTVYLDANGNIKLEIERSRVQKNVVIMKIKGIDDIDKAKDYKGKVIYMYRDDAQLEKGSFFVQDLIGMTVLDADDQSKVYGKITKVTKTGANDVYYIQNGDKEYLIPAIKQVVKETDIENDKMFITPLKGLFDDED